MCFYNTNIIAFAGRLHSGKSELSKICEELGYQKLYFALPLKNLSCKLTNMTMDELNENKRNNTIIDLELTESHCKLISDETQIPMKVVTEKCLGKRLKCVRDVLQFIGTDLIRSYNPNWHVDKVISMIKPDSKYVIDDVRFTNEKEALMKLGVCIWFVIRPELDCISNHESETTLKWQDFGNKVIVNDSTLEYFTIRWKLFMKDYGENIDFRDKIISKINVIGKTDIGSDVIMVPQDMFKYRHINFGEVNPNDIKKLDYGFMVNDMKLTNPFNIEDLKFNIKCH